MIHPSHLLLIINEMVWNAWKGLGVGKEGREEEGKQGSTGRKHPFGHVSFNVAAID